jgi:hypothetical protein
MLLVDKNTPQDAFELPLGAKVVTCRPTLYLGLAYLGISHLVRPIADAHQISPGSAGDYWIYLVGCSLAAFFMAQALEFKTRPLRQDKTVGHVRHDRAARVCNLLLGLGGGVPSVVLTGAHWTGSNVALGLITLLTVFGEAVYQTYGKKHPYVPAAARTPGVKKWRQASAAATKSPSTRSIGRTGRSSTRQNTRTTRRQYDRSAV